MLLGNCTPTPPQTYGREFNHKLRLENDVGHSELGTTISHKSS